MFCVYGRGKTVENILKTIFTSIFHINFGSILIKRIVIINLMEDFEVIQGYFKVISGKKYGTSSFIKLDNPILMKFNIINII